MRREGGCLSPLFLRLPIHGVRGQRSLPEAVDLGLELVLCDDEVLVGKLPRLLQLCLRQTLARKLRVHCRDSSRSDQPRATPTTWGQA